jgi:hypothetical protein
MNRKMLFREKISFFRGTGVVDISHLASGMYFLKIDNKLFKVIKN